MVRGKRGSKNGVIIVEFWRVRVKREESFLDKCYVYVMFTEEVINFRNFIIETIYINLKDI